MKKRKELDMFLMILLIGWVLFLVMYSYQNKEQHKKSAKTIEAHSFVEGYNSAYMEMEIESAYHEGRVSSEKWQKLVEKRSAISNKVTAEGVREFHDYVWKLYHEIN